MSSSFRLKYFLGFIPSAQKIDSEWNTLHKIHDELHQIETSKELARFNELDSKVQSKEFQAKKQEIIKLNFKESSEYNLISELEKLEKSKPIREYFKFIQSNDFVKFNQVAKSQELARYYGLKKIVESSDFIKRKKEIESLQYKGSAEYLTIRDYNSLLSDSRLKRYNGTTASAEFKFFLEFDAASKEKLNQEAGHKDPKVKRYKRFLNSRGYKNFRTVESLGLVTKLAQIKQQIEAKPFIDRVNYLKNKARYEATSDFASLSEFTKLSKRDDLLFYLKLIKSSVYINYQDLDGSKNLAHFEELKSKSADPGFKKRVEFLKNKKRYETTDSFKLETEYNELNKSKLLVTYRQLKKRPELSFFDQWEITLEETFPKNQLSDTLWEPENFFHASRAGYSFSQINELQAYNGIKNIEIKNSVLSIVTKAEKSTGKVWDPSIGLIPRQFEYSSAILNTGKSFKIKEGVIEAKVRFNAIGAITSAFSLTGSHPFPQIDIFRSGHHCVGLGVIDQADKNGTKNLVQIKGLNFNKFHVFRLEIFGNELVWKINKHEVHRTRLLKNTGELFLNFVGSLHQPINGGTLPHYFEIDWVRCLKKK